MYCSSQYIDIPNQPYYIVLRQKVLQYFNMYVVASLVCACVRTWICTRVRPSNEHVLLVEYGRKHLQPYGKTHVICVSHLR